jgi:hypothetical protein
VVVEALEGGEGEWSATGRRWKEDIVGWIGKGDEGKIEKEGSYIRERTEEIAMAVIDRLKYRLRGREQEGRNGES